MAKRLLDLFNTLNQADATDDLPQIEPDSYPALLGQLAMKVPVRPPYAKRRGVVILGPLEARLQRFDLTILGGLNEGSWPGGHACRSLVLAADAGPIGPGTAGAPHRSGGA